MTEHLLFRPTRVDVYFGCLHPPVEDWLRDTIDMAFVHADRIEIETWIYPADDLEPHLSAAEIAEDMAGDAASDWDRGC